MKVPFFRRHFYFATPATNDECTETYLLTAKFVSDSKRASGRKGEPWLKLVDELWRAARFLASPATRPWLAYRAHCASSARRWPAHSPLI
jgi:hypothetical protein